MTENLESLILEHLKHIRAKVDSLDNKVDNLTVRLNSVERSVALVHVDIAEINARMDGFDQRLARLEARLELVN